MTKTVVIANQKGGVGKTTTIINLSAWLAQKKKKILIIDMDPQGNAASGLSIDKSASLTTYDVLMNKDILEKAIVKTQFDNVDIVPANEQLSGIQVELVNLEKKEFFLKRTLDNPIKMNYDFIFIDTPPSLGLLSINAMTASDSVFIPIQCEYYALEGITQLLKTVKLVKQSTNSKLIIEGVCLTMYDNRTKLSKEVMESVVEHFKEKTYQSIIPRNIKLSEAPSHGVPIHHYWPNSLGSISYEKLADEFISKNGGTALG